MIKSYPEHYVSMQKNMLYIGMELLFPSIFICDR